VLLLNVGLVIFATFLMKVLMKLFRITPLLFLFLQYQFLCVELSSLKINVSLYLSIKSFIVSSFNSHLGLAYIEIIKIVFYISITVISNSLFFFISNCLYLCSFLIIIAIPPFFLFSLSFLMVLYCC
jgi:hypothetical protein